MSVSNPPDAAPSADRARLIEALQRVADQDRDSLHEVYRLSSAKLFGICLRICGHRQAAEDVLQEVYLTVWKRAGGFEPGQASPISWLAAIARNRAIDWRRANPAARVAPLDAMPEVADASLAQDERLVELELATRLHDCLRTLEERQQGAIRTAFFTGATYAELAERSGVPLGTMKSWVRRGLMRLRECLGGER